MKNLRKVFYLFLFSALVFSMLVFPKQALFYALTGLQLWFNKMIPTLLPFMILSGMMIQLHLNTSFMRFFSIFLYPVFRLNKQCLYVIFIGFLCGFPMGAKTCVQLYTLKRITKQEAEYLLSFCNNIGPIYFVSFVLGIFPIQNKIPFLIGMYGLPIIYGIFLRFTFYQKKLSRKITSPVTTVSLETPSLLEAIDISIMGSLRQIAVLGGYMVLFNVLNLVPFLFGLKSPLITGFCNCMLEITSGIIRISSGREATPLLLFCVFTSLIFGGLSCMAQTLSILRTTDLSSKKYLFHKCILWGLSMIYYRILLF